MQSPLGESSQTVQTRCIQARQFAIERQGVANHALNSADIARLHIHTEAQQLLEKAGAQMGWSSRSVHRILKVARTIADLNQQPTIESNHLTEAMQYRRSEASL